MQLSCSTTVSAPITRQACRVRATSVVLLPEPLPRQWPWHMLHLLQTSLLRGSLRMCWEQPAYLGCFVEPGQANKAVSSCACYQKEQPTSTFKPTFCKISFLRGDADASINRLVFRAAKCSRIMLYVCELRRLQGTFKVFHASRWFTAYSLHIQWVCRIRTPPM